jgi:hypothetical protein
VRGRLWRLSNPAIDARSREHFVKGLMAARRAVRDAKEQPEAMREARARVQEAKVALGERGSVWWSDGAPDFNRRMAENSHYADWFAGLTEGLP